MRPRIGRTRSPHRSAVTEYDAPLFPNFLYNPDESVSMGQSAAVRIPTVIESNGGDARREARWCPPAFDTPDATIQCRSKTAVKIRVGYAQTAHGPETDGAH